MKFHQKTTVYASLLCLCSSVSGCVKKEVLTPMYLSSDTFTLTLKDAEGNETEFFRGTEVQMSDEETENGSAKIYLGESTYYIDSGILKESREDCVLETVMFANETVPAFKAIDSYELKAFVQAYEETEIIGHSELRNDGSVEWYETPCGFVHSSHLEYEPEPYDTGYDVIHNDRGNLYGGGSADTLDYTPHKKPVFEDNRVPEIISAVYLNSAAVRNIDSYIEMAEKGNVNTFVIDIKDSDVIAVQAETMKKYSPSSCEHGISTLEEYCAAVKKANDAGIYTIGRITAFKDTWYASDHPENAIISTDDGSLFELGGSLWPTPYSKDVWEYNAALACEMAEKAGFNEIQFDYVRFPESVDWYCDYQNLIDLRNTENISRASAIQQFLIYVTEILHRQNVYVSADVFGETCNAYVSAYGQYWPAISNVVDAICAMPYPDHFSIHDYGITEAVWEVPEQLLTCWGEYAKRRQEEIPTPARVVTYIQGYDSLRQPYITYDREKIEEQISGLEAAGIHDGHIIWNSSSDLSRYISYTQ